MNKDCDCKNCKHVRKQQRRALSAARPSGKGMETVVDAWNDTLKSFPCLKNGK